jgi:hypothetical protein
MNPQRSTVTITFGDQAENHVGMEKLGTLSNCGFNLRDLKRCKRRFERLGTNCELIDIIKEAEIEEMITDEMATPTPAYLLIIRNGVDIMLQAKEEHPDEDNIEHNILLFNELVAIPVDKKALMRGKVVNKKARYNLCFSNFHQEPDYEIGKGTVVNFKSLPLLRYIHKQLPYYICEEDKKGWHNLVAEGNYYYDTEECGIGYHGDNERRRVIAIRLGKKMPLCYQWYVNGERIGKRVELQLNSGDIYIMSEKAVGYDWKSRITKVNIGKKLESKRLLTLRHAAGCEKYIK